MIFSLQKLLTKFKVAEKKETLKPMKWFFAYKEDSNPDYGKLIKVAVISARKNTQLEPFCIYDGNPSDLTEWLQNKDVRIIYHKSILYDSILDKFGNDLSTRGGLGALLRVDVPKILRENGINDNYILYTDCDVMFVDGVDKLSCLKPEYFACAPESESEDFSNMNTGVMIMNTNNLYKTYDGFISFIENNINKSWVWDQTGYNLYYKNKITKLPIEYNWKPYWGDSSEKKIVHFHGPKPVWKNYDRLKGTEHEMLYTLYNRNRESCEKMFHEWENLLSQA